MTHTPSFTAAKARVEAGDFSFAAMAALTVAHGELLVATDHLDRSASGVLAAEFTNAGRGRPAVLTINRIAAGRRSLISTHEVDGKREARAIAATLGATPWNF